MGNKVAFDVEAKDKFSTTFDKLGGKIDKLTSGGAKGLVIGAAAGVAAMAVNKLGDVAVTAFDKVVGGAARFQREMLNVNSITHASKAQLDDMGNSVLRIGGQFGQSAETMAKGLYDISSSGFQGAKAISILETSAKAATAGLSETGDAASGIVSVLNAYGMSAEEATHVSDVLFQTVNRGVVTFPELSAEIGKTTALAAPLGVSLEEVGAGLSVMTRHGIDAENATTQLNAIMSSMLQPSKEAAKLANELGIEWSVAGLKAKGLAGTLADMIAKTGGNEEQMAVLLGDVRAIRGAFTLGADAGREFTKELDIMENSAGALDDAFSVQKQGLSFKADQLGTKWDNLATKAGTVLIPAMDNIVDAALRIPDGFEKAGDASESWFDRIGGLGDAINTLNPAMWQSIVASEQMADAQADAATKTEESQAAIERAAANTADGFVSSSREMGRAINTFAARASDARPSLADLRKSALKTADSFDDLRDAVRSAMDQMIEDKYDPEQLRLELELAKDEVQTLIKKLGKLEDIKNPTKDQRHDITETKLELSRARENVDKLTGRLRTLNAQSVSRIQAHMTSLGLKIDWTSDRARELLTLLEDIDKGTAYDNQATAGGRHRAIGGAVQQNETYIVGEKGPELFSPSMSGYIIPNNQLQGGGSGARTTPDSSSGGETLIIQLPNVQILTPGAADQLAQALGPVVTKWQQDRRLLART